jgi:hypothetical protein
MSLGFILNFQVSGKPLKRRGNLLIANVTGIGRCNMAMNEEFLVSADH